MRWEDERYVRLYTRDTITWQMLPWQARAVMPLVMRVLDRAGILELGGHGYQGVAAIIAIPFEVVEPGLAALVASGVFVMNGEALVMPKFLEAQEAAASDAQRARECRARARDKAKHLETRNDRHETLQNVTDGHSASQAVTPSLAVPSRTEPCLAVPKEEERPSPPLPKKPADPFASGSALFAQIQIDRHEAGYATEKSPHPAALGTFFSAFMMEIQGDAARATATLKAYFKSDYWRARNFPFQGFMSEWRSFVPRKAVA